MYTVGDASIDSYAKFEPAVQHRDALASSVRPQPIRTRRARHAWVTWADHYAGTTRWQTHAYALQWFNLHPRLHSCVRAGSQRRASCDVIAMQRVGKLTVLQS